MKNVADNSYSLNKVRYPELELISEQVVAIVGGSLPPWEQSVDATNDWKQE